MFNSHSNKTYVVFEGRKPGIYTTWFDCHAQVNEFKGCSYKSYHTLEQAKDAWVKYCDTEDLNTQFESKMGIHMKKDVACGTSYTPSHNEEEDGGRHYVNYESQHFVIEYDMQTLLKAVCLCRELQEPVYTLHSSTIVGGEKYFRYYASLPTDTIGRPTVSIGRFAKTEEAAREDVAVLLLRRLLDSDGSKIRDYNYHNVEILESEIQQLKSEKFELQMENSMLTEELRLLRERTNSS